MPDLLRVQTSDGKYTIIQTEKGHMEFLRYGQPWEAANNSDWKHAGMILAMAQELEELQNILAELWANSGRQFPSRGELLDRIKQALPKNLHQEGN